MSMDGMQNWTNYLEVMRNRLLIVNDADSLIAILADVKNIPIALSTIEDVTDGTGLNMSISVICSEVKVIGRVMCLVSDDMFTTVQLNLDTVKTVNSKISVDGKGVVMPFHFITVPHPPPNPCGTSAEILLRFLKLIS